MDHPDGHGHASTWPAGRETHDLHPGAHQAARRAQGGDSGNSRRQDAEHDAPILTALSRAFHWQRLIDEGIVSSGSDIARREGLHQTTVNELLRLTLLSPTLVRSILDGHQPKTLSLLWLKNNLPPSDWDDQHALFDGFDA